MNRFLPLRYEDVKKLHTHGVVTIASAEDTIKRAVKANRSKTLSKELSSLAGMCQRAIVNPNEFKVMLHYREREIEKNRRN